MEINIEDYLSKDEIRGIVKDEFADALRKKFSDDENMERILSNTAYTMLQDEIENVVPSFKNVIKDKVRKVVTSLSSYRYLVFVDNMFGKKSLGTKYLEEAINENKDEIQKQVIKSIKEHNYTEEVSNELLHVVDNLTDNIYKFIDLIKPSNNEEK
jgi:hypothetical protein